MSDERRYVSVVEAAKRMDLSEAIVRKMAADGRLAYIRTSPRGHIRIRVDLDGYPVVTA